MVSNAILLYDKNLINYFFKDLKFVDDLFLRGIFNENGHSIRKIFTTRLFHAVLRNAQGRHAAAHGDYNQASERKHRNWTERPKDRLHAVIRTSLRADRFVLRGPARCEQ